MLIRAISLLIISVLVSACGLSPAYMKNSMSNSTDEKVCAWSLDTRTIAPWTIRKEAALETIKDKGIKCDLKKSQALIAAEIDHDKDGYFYTPTYAGHGKWY